ncbi:MAG: DNA repair exonuclease [Megasphaera sp.]|jgi:DNA repair exonuclease SbcCD nuclease subunit|uniref:metallophosphoesterase family protein n=1 Tax=Megasphaera sueciensis TaxID=349094 RepID=UPI003D09391A|nr:DNA repair exonuclease [Megasphaera sp.]MCI1822816.1 DNA repair exonuclease [Megasphaera sp.]
MSTSLRFIHCGDLHLGSPFENIMITDERWKRIIGKAPVRAFQKIVQAAIDKQVHAVLIAGDVYTSATHNLTAQLDYVRLLHKLGQHGIEVFAVHGNHDPLDAWKAKIPLPPNVHVFSTEQVERIPLIIDGEERAEIYGRSYAHSEERNNFAGEYIRHEDDQYAIGLMHTQVGGENSTYAPCTLNSLKDSGMDYWALGHVHTPQVLQEKPWIVYCGSPQGLDCTETGVHGCYYVEVGPYGTTSLQFIDTSIVRWESINVPIDTIESVSEIRENVRLAKEKIRKEIGRPTFLTVNFIGAGSMYKVINNDEAVQYWIDSWREEEQGKYAFVMVERVRNMARPKINQEERSKLPDMVGDYLNVSDKIDGLPQEEKLQMLREILEKRPEFERLGTYGRHISDGRLLEAFEKAKWLGMQRLLEDRRG